jgi:hypothetical protein
LRLLATGLLRHADEHIFRAAELLQLDLAQAQTAQRGAHLAEIGCAGFRLHLDERAADEVDAEIEAMKEEQADGEDG